MEDTQARAALESSPAEEVGSSQAGEEDLLGDLTQGLLFLERGPARWGTRVKLNSPTGVSKVRDRPRAALVTARTASGIQPWCDRAVSRLM